MTELMKQLQQWADEGRYDWQRNQFKTPHGILNYEELVFMVEDRLDFVKKDYRLRHRQMEKILLVLDGTIPVWRPVEHYKPASGMDGLALIGEEVFSGVFVCFPKADQVGFMKDNTEVWLQNVTHWQPLPQFIHEGKETNDV